MLTKPPRRTRTPEPAWDWAFVRQRCLREAQRMLAREDAEEAVQEALTRAWKRSGSCRTPDEPMAWFLQITRHEALRQLDRRRRIAEREREGAELTELPCHEPAVDRLLGEVATEQALAALRPEERRLIELRYVDDLTQPQVARMLDIPEGTVKVRLYRLRRQLQTVFAEQRSC